MMLTEERKARIREKIFAVTDRRKTDRSYELIKARAFQQAYDQNRSELLHERLRSKLTASILDAVPAAIDEDDLLAGRIPFGPWTEAEQAEWDSLGQRAKERGRIDGTALNATAHRVIDYEKLLAKGINGVLAEVIEKREAVAFSDLEAAEKRSFYDACITELQAVLRFQEKYRAEALRLLSCETDPARKKELEAMAAALAKVPAQPAESFAEAIQSMWFMQFTLQVVGDTSLTGRPDNYLYPFYKKDLAEGRITEEEAFSLIEDLYFRHNDIYGSWPASIMVGGRNRQGEPNWNELSWLFIRAIESTGLVNPSVSVCYNEAMPEDLLTLCMETIARGYTRPAIFNDDVVIKGLKEAGVPDEDANYYIHSTCVEITPIAASNILVATPYINLNKVFEYLFNDGEKMYGFDVDFHTPMSVDLDTLDTFDRFYETIKEAIDSLLKGTLSKIQDEVLYRKRYGSSPLASCFLNDCLAQGKDAGAGGARYSFIYPCFPGFLNLVDSLAAIRKAVYEDQLVTLQELGGALKNNFEDERRLRAFLLNKCPKFGNDQDESDQIAKDLFLFIKKELDGFGTSLPNGTFHPSYFAWIMHGHLGAQSAATPDGRSQAEALSECLGSVQGMDRSGPIALMHSTSKIPQHYGIGGIATNFRFSKKFMNEGLKEVIAFVREFMRNENFEAQFNVVDQDTLLDAQKHPEKYRTLLVRVAGYSDYFVDLSPIIQNEIIKRLEHDGM